MLTYKYYAQHNVYKQIHYRKVMLKEGISSKYFFIGTTILAAIITLLIVYPFLSSIIAGAILAYLFYPVYKAIRKIVRYKGPAAFITAVLIIILVAIPSVFLVQNVTKETHYIYIRAKQHLATGEIIDADCYENTFLCKSIRRVNTLMRDDNIKGYMIDRLNEVLGFITKRISDMIFSLPKLILYIMMTLFTTYYTLKDGKEFIERAAKTAPLKVHHQEEITKQFNDVLHAVIYGSLVVSIIQGTLGAFGLWLFGIKGFIWLGIAMTFFALIPFIGTWIVWLPASLSLGLTGYVEGETALIWRGIGLFFYGLLIISTVDNILKPIIVGNRARVHPLLILIGILGGLFAFGFMGLIIGPIILAIFQTLLIIYERERKPHLEENKTCILGRKNHFPTSKK